MALTWAPEGKLRPGRPSDAELQRKLKKGQPWFLSRGTEHAVVVTEWPGKDYIPGLVHSGVHDIM